MVRLFFYKRRLYKEKWAIKRAEVHTDMPTAFESGDTAADIQKMRRRESRERERGGGGTETEGGEAEGGSHDGANYTLSRGGSGLKEV